MNVNVNIHLDIRIYCRCSPVSHGFGLNHCQTNPLIKSKENTASSRFRPIMSRSSRRDCGVDRSISLSSDPCAACDKMECRRRSATVDLRRVRSTSTWQVRANAQPLGWDVVHNIPQRIWSKQCTVYWVLELHAPCPINIKWCSECDNLLRSSMFMSIKLLAANVSLP